VEAVCVAEIAPSQPPPAAWRHLFVASSFCYEDRALSRWAARRRKHRHTGELRVRWTLNLRAAARVPADSAQFADHLIVWRRFCKVLGLSWAKDACKPLPATYADCPTGRCRHYLCRWHLSVERSPLGSLHLTHPEIDIRDRSYTCMWRFIEDHSEGASMSEVGEVLVLGKPRIHGIWEEIRAKLQPSFVAALNQPAPA
jgi:hypothetical protein